MVFDPSLIKFQSTRESFVIGQTDFSVCEIRELVDDIGNEFHGMHYHLIHKNCNHFTDAISKVKSIMGCSNVTNYIISF